MSRRITQKDPVKVVKLKIRQMTKVSSLESRKLKIDFLFLDDIFSS